MAFRHFEPNEIETRTWHGLMLGAIGPRPIAFASTVDKEGNVNLAPFSFFNVFGSNPPTLIFSPARRVRNNTIKHTLENVQEVKEVVVNIVSYDIVEQMNLASTEYERGVSEFERAGFTPEKSLKVRPPRVKESPAHFECKVKQVIETGSEGGAGNLIVCEVLAMHVNEDVLMENQLKIDPYKIDLVGRMGQNYYTRAAKGIFQMNSPRGSNNIGWSGLPDWVRTSRYFTGNNLARLATVAEFPSREEAEAVKDSTGMQEIYEKYGKDNVALEGKLQNLAKNLIEEGKEDEAWRVLFSNRLDELK